MGFESYKARKPEVSNDELPLVDVMRISRTLPSLLMVNVAVAWIVREARAAGSMLDCTQFCEIRRRIASTYAG